MEILSVADAVAKYVETRDKLRLLQKNFNEKEAELKDELSVISMWLRDRADEMGVDNFKTKFGTAYRSKKTSYRIEDWDAFVRYIKETDNFTLIEKRCAKRATAEVHESEGLPPGLTYLEETEFLVNRAKG